MIVSLTMVLEAKKHNMKVLMDSLSAFLQWIHMAEGVRDGLLFSPAGRCLSTTHVREPGLPRLSPTAAAAP